MATASQDGLFDENGNIKPLKNGGRWAIGRDGINLIERSSVEDEQFALQALALLRIRITEAALDQYFPKDADGRRCPTFAFMRLWYAFGGNQNRNGSVLV